MSERCRVERRHRRAPRLGEETHTGAARGKGPISSRQHPTAWLRARGCPGIHRQRRPRSTEVDGVRRPRRRDERFTRENRRGPVHLFLDDQVCAIDIGLVPVVAVGPAQHVSEVAVVEGAEGARRKRLGVGCRGTEHGAVTRATGIGDKTCAARDGENAETVCVATPDLAVGGGAPQRLIGPLEGVGAQHRPGCRNSR